MAPSNPPMPLTRDQLHEIAVRRRGDADVLMLLLEIKRLHGVLVRAHDLTAALPHYPDDLNAAYSVRRIGELLEAEPAIDESHVLSTVQQVKETEGDRAAKRRARD